MVEGGKHPGVIAEAGDGGSEAVAEGLVCRAASQVVVAACAGRLGHDLHLTGVCSKCEHGSAREIPFERRSLPVEAARVQFVEGEVESAQVLLPGGGDDVDPVGYLAAAMDDATERADHDVGDPVAFERLQHLERVEDVLRHRRSRVFNIAASRSCGDRSNAFCSLASFCASISYGTSDASRSKPQARTRSRSVSKLGWTTSRSHRAIWARSLPLCCDSSTWERPARSRASRISVPLVTPSFYSTDAEIA